LAPPYWINMGAMAISTLAGSQLILSAPDALFLYVALAAWAATFYGLLVRLKGLLVPPG
jgi:hypothetical protein